MTELHPLFADILRAHVPGACIPQTSTPAQSSEPAGRGVLSETMAACERAIETCKRITKEKP